MKKISRNALQKSLTELVNDGDGFTIKTNDVRLSVKVKRGAYVVSCKGKRKLIDNKSKTLYAIGRIIPKELKVKDNF